MKKLFTIVFLIILSGRLCGQNAAMIVNHSLEYTYQKAPLRNTPRFNAEEIKANKIRSCTIIHPMPNGPIRTRTDLHGHKRAFFEHRKNQCRIRVYDTKTNALVGKPIIHFKITDETIMENDGHFTVKFTRLYKDRNLFSHFSDKQNGSDMKDEYFFVYDHFEEPGSDSKNPILTKG